MEESKAMITPVKANPEPRNKDEPMPYEKDAIRYRSIVGCLLYFAMESQLDLCVAVPRSTPM